MSEDKTADSLANPILNSPYFPPEQHFELGPNGPTGTVKLTFLKPLTKFDNLAPGSAGSDDY